MTTQSNPRLQATFKRLHDKTAVVPYITAGDPSVTATVPLMHALVKAGADVLELGVPFSDPMADGAVIQRAAERAVARGVGLREVLQMVAEFRQHDTQTPVVLMGYANPIEAIGQADFAKLAAQAGVDGVLTVDYPPEEATEFFEQLSTHQVDPIFLLAPTSTEARVQQVAKVARGYIYYVSLKGVTGAGTLNTDAVAQHVQQIRQHTQIPIAVGFGIRDAESAQRLSACADAVVIGSKLIETMEEVYAQTPQDDAAIQAAAQWLQKIHAALN